MGVGDDSNGSSVAVQHCWANKEISRVSDQCRI